MQCPNFQKVPTSALSRKRQCNVQRCAFVSYVVGRHAGWQPLGQNWAEKSLSPKNKMPAISPSGPCPHYPSIPSCSTLPFTFHQQLSLIFWSHPVGPEDLLRTNYLSKQDSSMSKVGHVSQKVTQYHLHAWRASSETSCDAQVDSVTVRNASNRESVLRTMVTGPPVCTVLHHWSVSQFFVEVVKGH